MRMKRTLPILFLSLIVALVVGNAKTLGVNTEGTTPCQIGQEAAPIGFWTWAANAHVKVYVVGSDFKSEELPFLLDAFKNWNMASEETGSGVRFEYQGTVREQLTCENCLTVMRGPVFDKTKRHATELKVYSLGHNQIITYAAIVMDPKLTNPKAMRDAIAHELGHNLGLLDCYTCKKKSTLMNQLKAMNVPNDMATPTRCDIAQVKAAYQELKVRVRSSPSARNIVDEGEEPVDDDTPVVVPTP